MIELIITLLLLLLVLYILNLVLSQMAIDATMKNIIYLIIVVVVILWLLNRFGIVVL